MKDEDNIKMSQANDRIPPLLGKEDENYNDSFVFEGSDNKGNLFMTRLGFRGDGSRGEIWLWMVLDGIKYVIPVDEDSIQGETSDKIAAGNLKFTCTDQETGSFKISYSGPLNDNIKNCTVDVDYKPVSAMYHSGNHIDAMTFGKSMAEMPWSKEYFENLRSENQCRIEQGGFLSGTVTLDEKEITIDMHSIRDHSWGKRNWNFIKRYIWNIISFEENIVINKKEYNYMIFTTANYGTTFEHIVSGWIAGNDNVLPIVEGSDMNFCGEDSIIPERYTYQFRPKGGPLLDLKINRSTNDHSWFTQNKTFEICEAYCSVECSGIKGHGMSEFGYSKQAGYKRKYPL